MAAVQQRTHAPVDARQRRAFIESMEEEIRRASEHLDIRRNSYKAMRGSSARSGEMVNGHSHPASGGPDHQLLPRSQTNHEPGASASAGIGISSRRIRVNRHPRQLSVPPEDGPGLSHPRSGSANSRLTRDGYSLSPDSPVPLSAPPVGGRKTTWTSGHTETRLRGRRRGFEGMDGGRRELGRAAPVVMPAALPSEVMSQPLPDTMSPLPGLPWSPPPHCLPPPIPPRKPKAVPPPPPPMDITPSPSPPSTPTDSPHTPARSDVLSPMTPVSDHTLEDVASSTASLPAGAVHGGICEDEMSAPEVKPLPMKASSAPPPSPMPTSPVEHTTVSTKRDIRSKSASKIHITVSSTVDKSRQVSSKEDAQLPGVVRDLRARLMEAEEKLKEVQRQRSSELKERDEQIDKLNREGQRLEREKWELLKRARDGAERSLHLRTQLELKESALRAAQINLERTKGELVSVKSANTSLRALLTQLRAPKSSVDVGIQVEMPSGGTLRRNPSIELALTQGMEEQDSGLERSTEHRMSTSTFGDNMSDRMERTSTISIDSSLFERESHETTPVATPTPPDKRGKKKRGILFGRMRRSSGRGGSTASIDGLDLSQSSMVQGSQMSTSFPYSTVNPEIHDHWRVLEEFRFIPFNQWNVRAIVAWMEVVIGMSQYTALVRERVTSGHALLALTDSDMERRLGISNPLHRRKLRLAIEEYRSPSRCRYPLLGKIDHHWVACEWATDCGLPHLSEPLMANMVDGRVLNSLTKEDLKKLLKIGKKSEQLSFLTGVELLRMHEFNREAIQEHRRTTRNPLYWTNRDVCDWLRDIQLEECADYVLGTGVHGALLFLERGTFGSEQLANILHISHSKTLVRRKLASKMTELFSGELSESQLSLPETRPLPIATFTDQPPTLRSPTKQRSPSVPLPDCTHPTRSNSLRSFPHLSRIASNPSFLTSSDPATAIQAHIQDRARHSLRESALRSVAIREETPVVRSLTPTILSSSTTV